MSNAFNEKLGRTRSHEAEFLGLSQEQAVSLADQLGIVLRVLAEGDAITLDWHPGRITVWLSFDVTTDARAG
jgi:hypothetical protein